MLPPVSGKHIMLQRSKAAPDCLGLHPGLRCGLNLAWGLHILRALLAVGVSGGPHFRMRNREWLAIEKGQDHSSLSELLRSCSRPRLSRVHLPDFRGIELRIAR